MFGADGELVAARRPARAGAVISERICIRLFDASGAEDRT